MPAFWAAYDATKAHDDILQRALGIGRHFLLPNAATFTAAGFNGGSHGRFYDDRLARWLSELDAIAAGVKRLSKVAPGTWFAIESRFRKRFPAYEPTASVWFLISLFSFDGYTREWAGRQQLFFGVDGIVQRHGPESELGVLFSHELFHLYHASVSKLRADRETVGFRLWLEGLASYVSQLLNPEATTSEVLLDRRLDSVDSAIVSRAATTALAALGSSDPATNHRLFDMNYEGDLPPRMGYLLGYRVAKAAARRSSLDDLIVLAPEDMRRILTEELRKLTG